MRSATSPLILLLALAAPGVAQPILDVQDIGPNGAGLLTGNTVGVDIFLDVVTGEAGEWLHAGFLAQAHRGALVYAQDPNEQNQITYPARWTASREVTFVSEPRPQSASTRFGANGKPNIAGGFIFGGLTATATLLDVASFSNDYPTEPLSGYLVRIVIDLTSGGIDRRLVYVRQQPAPANPLEAPLPDHPDDILVASGFAGAGTLQFPDARARAHMVAWAIYAVPEPASLGLLSLAAILVCCRWRRT